jgi:hypothetical protein
VRHGRAQRQHLGTRGGGAYRAHRQPAADVVAVDGGVPESERDQCGGEFLRIAARDGIHRHHRRASRLREARGRAHRVQIREHAPGARQARVPREVGERCIELAGGAVQLRQGAAAVSHELCASGLDAARARQKRRRWRAGGGGGDDSEERGSAD